VKNSAVRTGRIGELITMAVLEKMNVDTVHHPTEGFDLVAFPGRHIVRIEVKAATTLEEQRQQYSFIAGKGKEKRIIDLSDCDIIAFVAVDLNRVYFKSVHDLKTVRNRVDKVSFMLEQQPVEVFITQRGKASNSEMEQILYDIGVEASKLMQHEDFEK